MSTSIFSDEKITVQSAKNIAVQFLEKHTSTSHKNSGDGRLDADYLLQHVLGKNSAWLRINTHEILTPAAVDNFSRLVQRRAQGEPVAYLVGARGFWSLELSVNEHTLIPRPETELLVEAALEKLDSSSALTILDLGTGSGAIALALKKERPLCAVMAVDASAEALAVAEKNARDLQLTVSFFKSDWFSVLQENKTLPQLFNVIVSNPPYIAAHDVHLSQGDLRFEPITALRSADNGLQDIATICAHAGAYLAAHGWLLIEHGYDQGEAVRALLAAQSFVSIETRRDLSGHERITLGCRAN